MKCFWSKRHFIDRLVLLFLYCEEWNVKYMLTIFENNGVPIVFKKHIKIYK